MRVQLTSTYAGANPAESSPCLGQGRKMDVERAVRRDGRTGNAARLDVLDGLRGLAVLVVLASHFSAAGLLPRPALHGVGKSGVYLFFVLSAYLLARNLLRQPPGALRQARTWLDYALRRVLRIWPLYLVVLAASWLALSAGRPLLYDIDTAALWRHLTLREGRSVLWSIPVEFTFYLWLPLLVLVLAGMARWRWPAWAQTGVFLVALAAVTWRWPPAESVENGVQLGPYLAVFLCGAFAARVDEWAARRPSPTWWGAAALLAMALWCIAIPVIWCRLRGMPFEATVTRTWYLFFGMIWAALLLATLHGPAWLQRAFAWPGLRWVGLVSFSLYLWHMPVMEALLRAGVIEHLSWAAVLVVLAVALAVAWLSWRLFERPLQGIRLRRQR
ncbi:acyltransferase family protein [Stenotrophomonas acidaminiphila]|uniref:acyltransferase family protein n=1 Tax=Stenotrophomonas acidaminiphila TaxID=128780 RepID=UPI003CFD6BCE